MNQELRNDLSQFAETEQYLQAISDDKQTCSEFLNDRQIDFELRHVLTEKAKPEVFAATILKSLKTERLSEAEFVEAVKEKLGQPETIEFERTYLSKKIIIPLAASIMIGFFCSVLFFMSNPEKQIMKPSKQAVKPSNQEYLNWNYTEKKITKLSKRFKTLYPTGKAFSRSKSNPFNKKLNQLHQKIDKKLVEDKT